MPHWRTVKQIAKRTGHSLYDINSLFVANVPEPVTQKHSVLLSSKPIFKPLKILFLISPDERKDIKKEHLFQFTLHQLNSISERASFFINKFSQAITEKRQKYIFEELINENNIENVAKKYSLTPTQVYQIIEPVFDTFLISSQDIKKFKISIIFIAESFTDNSLRSGIYICTIDKYTAKATIITPQKPLRKKIRFI